MNGQWVIQNKKYNGPKILFDLLRIINMTNIRIHSSCKETFEKLLNEIYNTTLDLTKYFPKKIKGSQAI